MNTDRFKFRVYAFELKRYCNNIEIAAAMMNALMQFDITAPDVLTREQCLHLTTPGDECVYEQCTGLKDKNGKLIYEGDMCLLNNQIGNLECVVIWHNGAWHFEFYDGSSEQINVLVQEGDMIEIIGNIHESEAKA